VPAASCPRRFGSRSDPPARRRPGDYPIPAASQYRVQLTYEGFEGLLSISVNNEPVFNELKTNLTKDLRLVRVAMLLLCPLEPNARAAYRARRADGPLRVGWRHGHLTASRGADAVRA
jgi:hypothetical protein